MTTSSNSVSQKLFLEACKHIPGGVNSPARAFKGVGGTPVFVKKAKGAIMTSEDNIDYIDYVGSWGPMIAGHSHPKVVNAVKDAVDNGLSFGAPTSSENDIAIMVKKLIPSIKKIRFVNSGTEATMSALRLARGFTNRDILIKFEGCYHGHADSFLVKAGSGMLTHGQPTSPGIPKELIDKTVVLEFNNTSQIEKFFNDFGHQVAAVIVEPIAGNMNCIPATPEFLKSLRQVCDSFGSILIFDEVMTGFRVALGGAQELYNIQPDLTTIGKIIGGGMPVGAFGGRDDIMDQLSPNGPIYQAGTLSGNPIAVAAGLATLKIVQEEGFYDQLNTKTQQLLNGFHQIADECGVALQTNQKGGMFGLFLESNQPVTKFSQVASGVEAYNKLFHGLLNERIYMAPSAYEAGFVSQAHTDKELNETLNAFDKVLNLQHS